MRRLARRLFWLPTGPCEECGEDPEASAGIRTPPSVIWYEHGREHAQRLMKSFA